MLSRRNIILAAMGLSAEFALGQHVQAQKPAQTKPNGKVLVRPQAIQLLNTRSKMVLELEGNLRVKERDNSTKEDVRKAEVKALSTLDYFERVAFDPKGTSLVSCRDYVLAEAEHWVSGNKSKTTLREKCFDTRVVKLDGSWQQFATADLLDVNENELLKTPIHTTAIDLLLPTEPARANQPWSISAEDAREIFNLDRVHNSTLTAQIQKVEGAVATIELKGQIEGTANSVATQLLVKGTFQAKLASQCAMVSWLGMIVQERRSISQSEPGFDITARVRLLREEQAHDEFPNYSELLKVAEADHSQQLMLKNGSLLGRYFFIADRRWKTYVDTGEEAIFRMIENDNVVAQCNVSRLPALDAGKQLSLEALQSDIKRSLGEKFQDFVQSSEKLTPSGLRKLCVIVSGQTEEVPIQWSFNHLSDDLGQRVSLIFTMGASMVERFTGADDQICDSFEIVKPSEEQPTEAPAKPVSKVGSSNTSEKR